MAQFHLFPDLPKELRDCIWDMAICDDDPAVHFFTIYDAQDDSNSAFDPTNKVHATRNSCVLRFSIGFAAPRFRGCNQVLWAYNSRYTYLTDSALWTACHESRERMLRHLRGSEGMNMGFIPDNGERQYLTIRPSADLFCLQRPDNSNISLDSRYHWESIHNFPLFRWHRYVNPWKSSRTMNVAIEYDPAWEIFDPRKDCGPFQAVTNSFGKIDEKHGLVTFWFIDYRLTRKYKPGNRERQMFRAGNLAFVEVDSTDWEWCCCPKEGCLEGCFHGSGRYTHRAHDLVDELQLYIDSQPYSQPDKFYGYDRFNTRAGCRVLACVDLESEGELPTEEEWYERRNGTRRGIRAATIWSKSVATDRKT